jgi:hypothetical protein
MRVENIRPKARKPFHVFFVLYICVCGGGVCGGGKSTWEKSTYSDLGNPNSKKTVP